MTSQVRPDAARPTEAGFEHLARRNGAAAALALVIAVPLTIDHFHLSEDELLEATEHASGLIGSREIRERQIESHVEEVLGRDVEVEDVTSEVAEASGSTSTGDDRSYEVRPVPRLERFSDPGPSDPAGDGDDEKNGPTVCVQVSSTRVEGVVVDSVGFVNAGRCD